MPSSKYPLTILFDLWQFWKMSRTFLKLCLLFPFFPTFYFYLLPCLPFSVFAFVIVLTIEQFLGNFLFCFSFFFLLCLKFLFRFPFPLDALRWPLTFCHTILFRSKRFYAVNYFFVVSWLQSRPKLSEWVRNQCAVALKWVLKHPTPTTLPIGSVTSGSSCKCYTY